MNIVLTGYRCSGKTSIGKILASELGIKFLDTDELIEEHEGCPIETIVSERGWDHFREVERIIIKEASRDDNLVIATGGGAVMDEENVENLKKSGWVVWLKGEKEVLRKRMHRDQRSGKSRPSLTEEDALEEIGRVLQERAPFYERAKDLTVDGSLLSKEEVADLIIKGLPKKPEETGQY